MANKTLFQSIVGRLIPRANARNEAGGVAYRLQPKHALAQMAATGCMNATYYADASRQLEDVMQLCGKVEPAFIARTALFARQRGYMKDMPALLCAVLASRDAALLAKVFDRVIDNAKMLRNFVQILRSGVAGRKSFGTAPKRLVLNWLASRGDDAVFRASVGQSPSLADVVRMVHPKPTTESREALYAYLLGREPKAEALPELVRHYEAFKAGDTEEVPNVPFEMLTALKLGVQGWTAIARQASWQSTRMNLNTFARHGVFEQPGMTALVAERLRNPELIQRARAFPYQLMAAFFTIDRAVPREVADALQDAMEIATRNVPVFEGNVVVCPDVSGSMQSPVTGHRPGATSAVRCVDVAALVAATVLRNNPSAEVIPFEDDVVDVRLNPRDTVMTNAQALAAIGGGGTNCSAPLAMLNRRQARADVVIYVSDNESWVDFAGHCGSETMAEWQRLRTRNPRAKLVCIDVQPYHTVQAVERADILNVGGFSDTVFELIAAFLGDELCPEHWAGVIEAMEL